MKYKDLIFNLKKLEKEHDQIFDRIELTKEDFNSIIKETCELKFIRHHTLDIEYCDNNDNNLIGFAGIECCDEDAILKFGMARFFAKKFEGYSLREKPYILFTAIEILSEEELIIKKLLE